MLFRFSENNSGGAWWLNRSQYKALFKAGWKLDPEVEQESKPWLERDSTPVEERVPYGWRYGLQYEARTVEEAIAVWEYATGEEYTTEGCPCCGVPFDIH